MLDNNVSDNKEYVNKHYLLSSSTLPNTPSTKESVYYNTGRWSEEEHLKFLEGILEYGNEWKKVQNLIGTRSSTQARSHAQKFFLRIKKALQSENDETKDNSVMKYFFDILNNNGQVVSQNEHMQSVIGNGNQEMKHNGTGHFTASQKEKIINLIMKFNGGDDYMPAKKKENFTTAINNNILNGINNNNNVDNIEQQIHHQQQQLFSNIDSSTNSYYHDMNNNEMEIDEDSCSLSSSSTPLRYNASNSSNNNKIFRIDKGIRHKYSIDCLYKKNSNTFINNYFHNHQMPPSPNTNRIYEEMKSFFTKPQHSNCSVTTTTKNGIMMLSKRPRFNSSASASIDINFLDNKNFQDKPSPNPSRNSFNSTYKHSIPNPTNTYTNLISNPFLLDFDTSEIKEDFDNENCNIFEEHLSPY